MFKLIEKGHHKGFSENITCHAAAPLASFLIEHQQDSRPRLSAPPWPLETSLDWGLCHQGLLNLSSLDTLWGDTPRCFSVSLILSTPKQKFRKLKKTSPPYKCEEFLSYDLAPLGTLTSHHSSLSTLSSSYFALAKILRWSKTSVAYAQNQMWWCAASNSFTPTTKPINPAL